MPSSSSIQINAHVLPEFSMHHSNLLAFLLYPIHILLSCRKFGFIQLVYNHFWQAIFLQFHIRFQYIRSYLLCPPLIYH